MRVAAIVLNWNSFEHTKLCVRSLRAQGPPLEIVVVDNGSDDGSADSIELELPDVTLIRSEHNLGFAGGANLGMCAAMERGADCLWLLNNDAQAEPCALLALLAQLDADSRVGIVGGVLSEAFGGGRIGKWTGVTRPGHGPNDRLDYVAGGCMLVRREVLDTVGLFDDRFFFYYEDADFCLRARRAGWKLAVAPDARVEHEVGASVNRGSTVRSAWADRLQVESGGLFIGKYASFPRVAGGLRLLGIVVNRLARRQPRRIPELARALRRGVVLGRAADLAER